MSQTVEAVVSLECPRCHRTLQLPAGPRGAVRCPGCSCPLAPPAPDSEEAAAPFRLPAWATYLVLLALAAVPLGIPVLTHGGLGGKAVGLGLAALGVVAAFWPGASPAARGATTLTLATIGYAVAFSFLRVEDQAELHGEDLLFFQPSSVPPPTTRPRGSGGGGAPQGRDTKDMLFVLNLDADHSAPLLAVAFAPEKKAALVTRADGTLEVFRYPGFDASRGRWRLEQPGYRAALDARRGRLYVAAAPRPDPRRAGALRVNRYGDRPTGVGDLHVYDVAALLAGRSPGDRLRPAEVVPLGGTVSHLVYSPANDCVYYLADKGGAVTLGRVPAADPKAARSFPLEGATTLCVSTDGGKRLFAAGTGWARELDPRTAETLKNVDTGATAWDLATDNMGRLFVTTLGQRPQVVIVSTRQAGYLLAQFPTRSVGHTYLQVTKNGGRAYESSASPFDATLHFMMIQPELFKGIVPMLGRIHSGGAACGEIFLSPDDQVIVARAGQVFRWMEIPKEQPQRRGGASVAFGDAPAVPDVVAGRPAAGGPG
jgi:hypothetical protein